VTPRVTAPEASFGQFLRQQRLLTGLTLAEMAARLGVTHQMVAKYERGQSRLSIGRLLAISEALGRPLSALLAEFERSVGAPSQPAARLQFALAQHFARLDSQRQRAVVAFVQALSSGRRA
jgi:transcriptional regulator with XRE-family HTH domain